MIKYDNVYLTKLAFYVPEKSVSNDEIIQKNSLKISNAWIEKRLGITNRRWAEKSQSTSDLAVIVLSEISKGEAPLFFSTISPDYLTPSTSSEINSSINIS
jgi:3-oxoacyl-[acyl-carrier-protein] synthase-3